VPSLYDGRRVTKSVQERTSANKRLHHGTNEDREHASQRTAAERSKVNRAVAAKRESPSPRSERSARPPSSAAVPRRYRAGERHRMLRGGTRYVLRSWHSLLPAVESRVLRGGAAMPPECPAIRKRIEEAAPSAPVVQATHKGMQTLPRFREEAWRCRECRQRPAHRNVRLLKRGTAAGRQHTWGRLGGQTTNPGGTVAKNRQARQLRHGSRIGQACVVNSHAVAKTRPEGPYGCMVWGKGKQRQPL